MKKLFSVLFLMALLTSVVSLVGCNGLWGFDDDDDVVVPAGVKFNLAGSVIIPGDGIVSAPGDTSLRAVKVSDGLKAEVWKKVAGKADEKVQVGDVDAEGKYALEFYNSPAYYFIKIVKTVDDGKFKMLLVLGSLTQATATQADKAITATSTAVAVLMEKDGADTTVEPAAFELAKKTDIELFAADLNTALKAAAENPTKEFAPETVLAATQFPIDTVKLNKATANMSVGTNETLTATVLPSYAFKTKAEWASSDNAIATVDANGVVAPKLPGTAKITYTFTGVNNVGLEKIVSGECLVTVTQPVSGVKLDQADLNLFMGNEVTLTATVEPVNASNKEVLWSSSNSSVAEVVADATDASKAKVTAKGVGSAVITVTTKDGSKSFTCSIKVAAVPVNVTSVTLSDVTMVAGNAAQTLVPVLNSGANTMTGYAWTSSDPLVATVDPTTGSVKPIKAGFTTITLTLTTANTSDPKVFTATCKVTVDAAPLQPKTAVTLDKQVSHDTDTTLMVNLGETWIQISGVATTLTPTVTLKDVKGNTIVLGRDADLTAQSGILTLIGQTVNGLPLDAESGDPFKKYAGFTAITFSSAIPGEATVKVVKFDGKSTSTLATEEK